MNKRLEQFMKSEELTSAKLAEILSVQPSSISHLLAGRNKPNFDFISNLLLMFPNLNPRWIINGEGAMYLTEKRDLKSYEETSFSVDTDVNNSGFNNLKSSYNRLYNKEIGGITNVNRERFQVSDIGGDDLPGITNVTNSKQAEVASSSEMFDQFRGEILSEITSVLKTQLDQLQSEVNGRIEELSTQTADPITLDELNNAVDKRIAHSINTTELSRKFLDSDNSSFTAKVLTQVMLFYSDGTFETLSK